MKKNLFVPVTDQNNKPLMPMKASRARKLVKQGQATPFWKLGIFAIRLNKPTMENVQPVGIGIDSGSKKEAYSIMSQAHHLLNIQCDAITWIKDNMEFRVNMRRGRRSRKTPCRQPRWSNRASAQNNRLVPSTKARWQLKVNLVKSLTRLYPLTKVKIEDIQFTTMKGKSNKNVSFGPLQVGKKYFKQEMVNLGLVFHTNPGYETAKLRRHFKLNKIKDKMSKEFEAHVVDSAVMVANMMNKRRADENRKILHLLPIKIKRRALFKVRPLKKGIRGRAAVHRNVPLGLSAGSIVKLLKPTSATLKANPKSFFLAGGYSENKGKVKATLSKMSDKSDRIITSVDPKNIKFLCYNRFMIY